MAAIAKTDGLLTTDIVVPLTDTVDVPVDEPTDSVVVNVEEWTDAMLYLFIQGEAGNTLGLVVTMQVSPDGVDEWFDLPALTVIQNGATRVTDQTTNIDLDLSSVGFIRVGTLQNLDSNDSCTVNAGIYKGYKR